MTGKAARSDGMRLLGEFLVDNPELEALSARLGEFNIFRTLRIVRQEIRHSNVLGWLLDPTESHGLGAHFLRRFLSRLLLANEDVEVPFSAAQAELMPLDSIIVRREWLNIDLLVQDTSAGWCLLIENKVGSKESRGQLSRYEEAVRAAIPGVALIPVFLTPSGEEPSEGAKKLGYIPISYEEVLDVVEPAVAQFATRIPVDAAVFLKHYVATLRRLTMRDEELVALCKTIYRRHREAIDLIVEYGSASHVIDACKQVIREQCDPEFVLPKARAVWFLPRAMAQRMTPVEPSWRFLPEPYPIMCWIRHNKKQGKLALRMELGPMHDSELRRSILDALKAGGFEFWEKVAYRDDAKYTRFLTMTKALSPTGSDEEPDEDAVRAVVSALWEKFWKRGKCVLEVLESVNWGEG